MQQSVVIGRTRLGGAAALAATHPGTAPTTARAHDGRQGVGSGGPVVGICSPGDSTDPGAGTRAGSSAANLTGSRERIRSVAGV